MIAAGQFLTHIPNLKLTQVTILDLRAKQTDDLQMVRA
jgi:hypothetical protein